jgi:hypothetical protein
MSRLTRKDTTESDKSDSYLDILLNIDSNGRLTISLYDKRDDFDIAIFNFPFLCSNILLSPVYAIMVCISPSWLDTQEHDFSKRGKLRTKYLMLQSYNESRLNHYFTNSTVVIMTLFAITYQWPILGQYKMTWISLNPDNFHNNQVLLDICLDDPQDILHKNSTKISHWEIGFFDLSQNGRQWNSRFYIFGHNCFSNTARYTVVVSTLMFYGPRNVIASLKSIHVYSFLWKMTFFDEKLVKVTFWVLVALKIK